MRATLTLPITEVSNAPSSTFAPTETSRTSQDIDAGRVAVTFPLHGRAPNQEEPRAIVHPRDRANRIAGFLLLGDWVVASLAILSALAFREWQVGPRSGGDTVSPGQIAAWSAGASVALIWIMMFFHSYEPSNLMKVPRFFKSLLRSILLLSLGIWACFGFFRIEGFTPRVGAVYSIFTVFFYMCLWRVLADQFIKSRRFDLVASSRVLLIGWSDSARRLVDSMGANPTQFGTAVGYCSVPGANGLAPKDLPHLGSHADLGRLAKEYCIDQIVLADLDCSSAEIQQLTRFCQRELISFQLIPNYFPALQTGLQVKMVNGVPLLGINELPLDRTRNRAAKRAIDIIGALFGIAISSLIVPWFCAAVFIESPGPVIYRQRRTSRSGRSFYIFKIRSMRLNAESSTGAVWCKKEDARRLRIGTFMRRWNIDELPQFFNVLKGEMSLVGPRPERPELIARFKNEIPNYNARHEVRSGLTGWAQIQGLRGDTDLSQRIEADLYYLENWSVFMDLYCLVATLFKTRNAH